MIDTNAERFDSRDLNPDEADDQSLIEELDMNVEGDWADGIQLIKKNYFVEYAKEYAENTGAFVYRFNNPRTYREETIDLSQEWPFRHIDWEAAADELAEDWVEVEYKGEIYLAR